MSIYSCIGDTGSGKTCYQTWYVHSQIDKGFTIASNYTLKGIDYILLETHEDLLTIADEGYEKILYALDENWLNADARRSNSLLNSQSTIFGMQHRKMHSDIFQTSQTWRQIDVRYRSQTMIWYEPEIIIRQCTVCDYMGHSNRFGIFEECPRCGKMKTAKPVMINVSYTLMAGKNKRQGNFIVPMQANFKHGYFDIPESYNTFEFVNQFELQTKDLINDYRDTITKYAAIPKLKANSLCQLLRYKEKITENDIEPLSQLIIGLGAMANAKEDGLI